MVRFPFHRPALSKALALVLASAPLLAASPLVAAPPGPDGQTVRRSIAVVWAGGRPAGVVRLSGGTISKLEVPPGSGTLGADGHFTATREGEFCLRFEAEGAAYQEGKRPVVRVATERNPFSFLLEDVGADYPIYLPAYGVVVAEGGCPSYHRVAEAIRERHTLTVLQQIENEPEERFETAAPAVRNQKVQTWLGLSRDFRVFAVGERLDWVQPKRHAFTMKLPAFGERPVQYDFLMGRGWGAAEEITRRLADGVLPILEGTLRDGDVTYHLTAFASLEKSPLLRANVRGTHFLVADAHSHGHMLTAEQWAQVSARHAEELNRPEETVLYLRLEAVNTSRVPRYAYFRSMTPAANGHPWTFDGAHGYGRFNDGTVFAVSRLNGAPMPSNEVARLLGPGEHAYVDVVLPHAPLAPERAAALAAQSYDERLREARAYWQEKLGRAASVTLPERRITEMVRAGLLHLDLITYGLEPDGTLAPTIGNYAPIGSESAPIIQFMDAMGWHDEARRALTYFLDKQHDDGFIQNFGGYMLETGAALWTMGEHYRYTRDDDWVRQVKPRLLKSVAFILDWRRRNLREELRGHGYGLLEGKTADPEDPFRSFMLNGYHYLGLSRAAEMLRNVDPAEAQRLAREAEAFRADIRTALFEAVAASPVVPLGDGTWSPSAPPWAGYPGPVMLFAGGGEWFSHGAVPIRDSVLGPLYLVFQEVLDPHEPAASLLLDVHAELMTTKNTAFSQPYYSRHPYVHLRRGEVKPFLKAYYNTVASLADRQTYTFWEHFYGISPHKTHEEAWFLMETRWMLYLEDGDTLRLLPGIPRTYLEAGETITLDRVASYFGALSVRVESRLDEGRVVATVECPPARRPAAVTIRLPHPQGRRPLRVEGGTYDEQTEQVTVAPFDGQATVVLHFGAN